MKLLSRETKFLLAIFIAGEIMGNILGFHTSLREYDTFMHFVGGALVASLIAAFLIERLKQFSYAINVFVTLGAGAAWEIFEFSIDRFLGFHTQSGLEDTMIDLIIVFSAAIAVNIIYWAKYK